MNTFEIECVDEFDREHQIHIVAPDPGEAMIIFRDCNSFKLWHVTAVRQVIAPTVIENYDE